MTRIDVKAFSVNKSLKGRKYKTTEYKYYEAKVFYELPKNLIIPNGKLSLCMKVGLSSEKADLDNTFKPFIDILQKKYNFNDRMIFKITGEKELVKKGEEYIEFFIEKI